MIAITMIRMLVNYYCSLDPNSFGFYGKKYPMWYIHYLIYLYVLYTLCYIANSGVRLFRLSSWSSVRGIDWWIKKFPSSSIISCTWLLPEILLRFMTCSSERKKTKTEIIIIIIIVIMMMMMKIFLIRTRPPLF